MKRKSRRPDRGLIIVLGVVVLLIALFVLI
jgi:hypothetical protein